MRTFSQEFHLAFRQLRRLPGIAATAVLALALGIGATFPEWEPNRLHSNKLWRSALSEFDKFILVTG